MPLISLAIKSLAVSGLKLAIEPLVEKAKMAAQNAAQDTVIDMASGKRGIEEWAEIIAESVDKVKERILSEGELSYVGGKLKFTLKDANNIIVYFELYFLDGAKEWHKADADTFIPSFMFTEGAMEELRVKSEVSYEVE